MKRFLTLIILAGVITLDCNAQQQDGQKQDNSMLGQYRREKTTVPYKVNHKSAKTRRVETRKGNNDLKKKNYSNAVSSFRNAIKADSNYAKAQYNRALAHSKLGQNDTALAYYNRLCQNSSATPEQRAKAHYNAGNIHLRNALAARDTGGYDAQSLRNAVEEYKAALRLDSKNSDIKHNLSLAKQLIRPERQNGGGQSQQNQDNQDQQNKDKQKQQNQDQQNQDQQNKEQQKQQQNSQNPQDKKQQEQRRREAEQMLNAMKNNEQQTMKSVRMKEANKEQRNANHNRIEKDW